MTGYPLPIHEPTGVPYWKINMAFNMTREGWAAWQKDKSMSQIIPEIDRLWEAQRASEPIDA